MGRRAGTNPEHALIVAAEARVVVAKTFDVGLGFLGRVIIYPYRSS
ncbi:MAG TPA: hypothetical protein VHK01_02990 [Lacipirellulaceae bacterium]|nr:hypothetical protein [Lacipirellulaceae bacterium]